MSIVNYNTSPYIELKNNWECYVGWNNIVNQILVEIEQCGNYNPIVVIECYQGVHYDQIKCAILNHLKPSLLINSNSCMHNEGYIRKMVYPDVTDDRIFGYLSRLNIEEYFDSNMIEIAGKQINDQKKGITVIYGPGASLITENWDLLIYADMARWEIQQRMRRHEVDNLGVRNRDIDDWMLLYKQGYFVDWRVLDRLKKKLMDKIDYVLDTNNSETPKMLSNEAIIEAYDIAISRPFSVAPFFDPGPWGGQWMKEKCGLDKSANNFAWCFNCVPEENSLLVKCGDQSVELPSINLVFKHPQQLLGEPVHARFGDEFPIRFDYLDTIDGGNLSLQVHPLTEYIQEKFGMPYTQDESYYLMDAKDDAVVYLGLKTGINPEKCVSDLREAQKGKVPFDDERHIQKWPAKKHDHFLIPAGTIHCSGKNSMVLEISATPYIFTFKLWDWGRVGLDGKPRPINIEHGKNVIQWYRTTEWSKNNLINQIEKIAEGDGWVEERTGLHEREFIETRRHWFTKKTFHKTNGSVNVICIVEGEQVVVECPKESFDPFVVNYAEVFIVPANVKEYVIRPYGISEGRKCATLKAYVRF